MKALILLTLSSLILAPAYADYSQRSAEEYQVSYSSSYMNRTEYQRAQRKKFDNKIIVLNGDNREFECNYRKIALTTTRDLQHQTLIPLLQESSFSPECLTYEMKYQLERPYLKDQKINGVAFGWNAAGAIGIGGVGGKEFVILVNGDDSIQVGVVSFYGISLDISLPIGAAITNGILYGKCNELDDYLGNFEGVTAMGVSYNEGTTGRILGIGRKQSGCNSVAFTLGASTSLLGASSTRYKQISDFVTIKGERVKELIEFFKSQQENRNFN